MASNMDGIIKKLISAMQTTSKAKTSGYDTSAVVRRIEDGTAWVHIPGGVDETPVKLTIAAKVGDVVQVRVADGRAFLVGNATAPPTDDALAVIAQYQADYANQLAALAKQSAENAETIAVQAYNTILIEYAVSPDDKYAEAIRAAENDYIRVTEDDFVRDVDLTIDGWYTEIPEIPEGYYLWTRITSTAEDGSTSVVYTVSAPGVAMEAKNTADAAQATAEDAQAAAEDAKKVANNYLSADTTGIMVADLADGTQTPSTATGRNVKVDSNGVYIRDGQTVKASFGDTVVIGEDNELNMEISSNKMDLDLMEENKFSVGWQLGQSDNRSFQGNISKSVTSLPLTISMSEFSDIEGDVYPFSAINGWFHISYTKNGEEYAYYSREGSESFTCTENTFTILDTEEAQEMIGGTITNVLLTYTTLEYPLAFMNFGERLANTSIGMFSAIMGKGLTATADNSLALGEYNFDLGWPQEDMIPIFSIGNGTDEDHQSNLFAVGEGQMYFADPRWDSTELEMINAPAFVVNGVGETYLRADAEYAGDSELRTAIYNLGLEESLIHSVGIEAAIIDMIEIKGMFAKILDMFVPKSITDISTLVTAASGVSIGVCRMAICGKIATLYLRATPSAAKSGTWQIGTLNTGYRPFEEVGFLTGTAASIGYIGTGGNITYVGSVSANANCYVKATFILA